MLSAACVRRERVKMYRLYGLSQVEPGDGLLVEPIAFSPFYEGSDDNIVAVYHSTVMLASSLKITTSTTIGPNPGSKRAI